MFNLGLLHHLNSHEDEGFVHELIIKEIAVLSWCVLATTKSELFTLAMVCVNVVMFLRLVMNVCTIKLRAIVRWKAFTSAKVRSYFAWNSNFWLQKSFLMAVSSQTQKHKLLPSQHINSNHNSTLDIVASL